MKARTISLKNRIVFLGGTLACFVACGNPQSKANTSTVTVQHPQPIVLNPAPESPPATSESREVIIFEEYLTLVQDHPELGHQVMQHPNGLIWGDLVFREDGTVHLMSHSEANEYCLSREARLPLQEEVDELRVPERTRYVNRRFEIIRSQQLPNYTGNPFWTGTAWRGSRFLFASPRGNVEASFFPALPETLRAVRCVRSSSGPESRE